jgi:hypothetical protein
MVTLEWRMSHGQTVYYAQARRKGFAPQPATFAPLDAPFLKKLPQEVASFAFGISQAGILCKELCHI